MGRSIEDLVAELCQRSFLADFTIKSPKYQKSGGLEKEAADLIVLFGDTLLAIQVKSKAVEMSAKPNLVEAERVKRTIEKAVYQFRALAEAVNSPGFTSFVNGRGVEIPFDKNSIKEYVFIVVFVPIPDETQEQSIRIRFDSTCYPHANIAVHLFSLEQFSLLLTLLNTLPDFLFYLTIRWHLHHQRLIAADSDPIDEWALLTFEKKTLAKMLEEETFTDILGFSELHRDSVPILEHNEKPSYFIDSLIERLCASIGYHEPVDPRFNLLAEPNSQKSYLMTVPYLAKLNRSERTQFTEFLINRVSNCQTQEMSFRAFKFSEDAPEAYLVLAAKGTRAERRAMLSNLAKGTCLKLNAKTVIGLTVSHEWPESPLCDVAVVDLSKWEPSEKMIEMTNITFGEIHQETL